MSAQIYIIEQLEDAKSHDERYYLLIKFPFAVVLTYQTHIERILRARNDEKSLSFFNAILTYLRATEKGRPDAFRAYISMFAAASGYSEIDENNNLVFRYLGEGKQNQTAS